MKEFHLPLPEHTCKSLRAHAGRTKVPATILARQAIECWLKEQGRKERHAIAAYAQEMAGSDLDLDRGLESAAIEHLAKTDKVRKLRPSFFKTWSGD